MDERKPPATDTGQTGDQVQGKRERPQNKPRSSSHVTKTDDEGATRTEPAGSWSAAGVSRLKRSFVAGKENNGTAMPPCAPTPQASDPDKADRVKFEAHYSCAKGQYNLRHDGEQRRMTRLEEATLDLWLSRSIYLAEPPSFITETHTSHEQDVFWAHQRGNLGYRLYAQLPVGFSVPETNSKWHFCHALMTANSLEHDRTRVKEMMEATLRTHCSPSSQVVELLFVRPDDRDKWANATFRIGRGFFTLRATDALARHDKREGYDTAAAIMLYQVHVLGRGDLSAASIRSWMSAATATTIMRIVAKEASGLSDFSPHVWQVTFDTIECPKELLNKRLLQVTQATTRSDLYLHHPRAAHRLPCKKCLGITHYRKDCDVQDPAASARTFTAQVTVSGQAAMPTIAELASTKERRNQLKVIRQILAPAVAARHKAEKYQRKVEAEQAKAKRVADAAVEAAQVRNAEVQLKRAEAARQKHADRAERHRLRAQVTAELSGARATRNATLAGRAAVATSDGRKSSEATPEPKGDALASPLTTTPENMDVEVDSITSTAPSKSPVDVDMEDAKLDEPIGVPSSLQELGNEPTGTPPSPQEQGSGPVGTPSPLQAQAPSDVSQPVFDTPELSSTSSSPSTGPPPLREAPIPCSPIAPRQQAHTVMLSPGKRERAESTTTLVQTEMEKSLPPQRLARANTLHKTARDLHHDTLVLKAAARETDGDSDGKRKAEHVQLTVAQFFSPRGSAKPTGAPGVSCDDLCQENDPTLAAELTTASYLEWLEALHARELDVPANGSCFYFALHGVKAAGFKTDTIRITKSNVREANFYKRHVNMALDANLESLLLSGSAQLKTMLAHYLPDEKHDSEEVSVAAVRRHIAAAARRTSENQSPQRFWAGAEEVMAAVIFLREPLFVCDVTDGVCSGVQMYFVDYAEPPRLKCPERVRVRPMNTAQAYRLLKTYTNWNVIPLVMALHHAAGGGHFKAVRFENDWYEQWTAPLDAQGLSMRDRMEAAHVLLDVPVIPRVAPVPVDKVARTESRSEYDPSHASSDALEQVMATGQATQALTTAASTTALRSDSDFDEEALADARARVNGTTRANDEAYKAIIASCTAATSTQHSNQRFWNKLMSSNQSAYEKWRSGLSKQGRAQLGIVTAGQRLVDIGEKIAASHSFWLGLNRTLPYPELFMALTDRTILVKVGKALVCAGRARQLELAAQEAQEDAQRTFLDGWRASLAADIPMATKWSLCQSKEHWARAASHMQSTFEHHPTDIVDDDDLALVTVSIMSVLRAIPRTWRSWAPEGQCAAALSWIHEPSNHEATRQLAEEIRRFDWSTIAHVLVRTMVTSTRQ